MTKHLLRDLEALKKRLLEVESMVEEATNKAITALTECKQDMAVEVIEYDDEIDTKEVQTEEECLKILALHQPVASDLRFVIGAMKVNNDLERMGDLAVNIAERVCYLAEHPPLGVPLDFNRMADVVRNMVRTSLDAHVNLNAELARTVGQMDDEVDDIHRDMYTVLQARMHEDPALIERAVHYLNASRDLERIADLATNVAEDVVFMVEGEVIRHRGGE
jgi:phosphate transport system protein